MFEGIEDINWGAIHVPKRLGRRQSPYSPADIPRVLPLLLDDDEAISKQALEDIFALVVQDDDISYFTDVAPLALPFLMEVFNSEGYPHKRRFVEHIAWGLWGYTNFAPDFKHMREDFKQVQIAAHASLYPYLDDFIEMLNHDDLLFRREIVDIITLYPQDLERLLPLLLTHVENIAEPLPYATYRDAFLYPMTRLIEHGNPSQEDLQRFARVCYQEFVKGTGGARMIIQASPLDVTGDVIEFLYKWFESPDTTKRGYDEPLFDALLGLIDLVIATRLGIKDILDVLIKHLRAVNECRQHVILASLKLKMDESLFVALQQALIVRLKQDTDAINRQILEQVEGEIQIASDLKLEQSMFWGDTRLETHYRRCN